MCFRWDVELQNIIRNVKIPRVTVWRTSQEISAFRKILHKIEQRDGHRSAVHNIRMLVTALQFNQTDTHKACLSKSHNNFMPKSFYKCLFFTWQQPERSTLISPCVSLDVCMSFLLQAFFGVSVCCWWEWQHMADEREAAHLPTASHPVCQNTDLNMWTFFWIYIYIYITYF